MKKYTHAWLAFMAMKRLEKVAMPEAYRKEADELVKWFKNYRDFVIEGAWYPDLVFKDMATSHIIKYVPEPASSHKTFKKLPDTLTMYGKGLKNELYGQPYMILDGNLPDRCEAYGHSIVDCFKMLQTEEKGCPISPTGNHIAMRFFILSHYVADCHMPLHCDSRAFSSKANIHGCIEDAWDKAVKKSYAIDEDNQRFFYDSEGYPLKTEIQPICEAVEAELINRPFNYSWGTGNNNTYDYMKAVSEYSYLLAYQLLPAEYNEKNLNKTAFKQLDFWKNFDAHSVDMLGDAVDSIARIWLHVWCKYTKWQNR